MPVKWYGPQVTTEVKKITADKLERAARGFRDFLREKVSVPNTATLTGPGGKHTQLRGANPSEPGEYPHKLTGQLRRNINMECDPTVMIARIGTNVLYGKFLELGTRLMEPRPWMSRGLMEFASRIKRIMES